MAQTKNTIETTFRKFWVLALLISPLALLTAQVEEPAITTQWTNQVDKENPLQEYPRKLDLTLCRKTLMN